MKKTILIVAIATVILFSVGVAGAFENEPEGFRGLKWGDPPTEDMTWTADKNSGWKVYRKDKEKLSLGEAQFYTILYSFYSPTPETIKFLGVGLYFTDEINFSSLSGLCKAKFGKPTQTELDAFAWCSQATMISLSYNRVDDSGMLFLQSLPLWQEWQRAKEKKQMENAEQDW